MSVAGYVPDASADRGRAQKAARSVAPALSPAGADLHPILQLQRLVGNRAVTALVAGSGQTGGGGSRPLPPVGTARKGAFATRARSHGLNDDQIEQLWQIGGNADGGGFAAAEQRTGALFSAARKAAALGVPTYYVGFKVAGLAELNARLGHSRADSVLTSARSLALERLTPKVERLTRKGGQVQALGDKASSFGFLVTGSEAAPASDSALAAAARSVAKWIRKKLRVSLTAEVMSAEDAATSAVVADLGRQDSATAARTSSATPGRPQARFTSTGTDRREAFLSLAQRFGLAKEAATGLYGMLLSARPDVLTGFEKAADREGTVRKAIAHNAATGTAAVYVEIDVRNLGGLNQSLGRQAADTVFAQIASTVEREMASIGDLGDAWPFRHGGDEFSFVVVARRPGISAGQLEFTVGAALTRAAAAVRQMTARFATVPHTKKGGPPGTGIAWGTSIIAAGSKPSDVFSTADRRVEQKKRAS